MCGEFSIGLPVWSSEKPVRHVSRISHILQVKRRGPLSQLRQLRWRAGPQLPSLVSAAPHRPATATATAATPPGSEIESRAEERGAVARLSCAAPRLAHPHRPSLVLAWSWSASAGPPTNPLASTAFCCCFCWQAFHDVTAVFCCATPGWRLVTRPPLGRAATPAGAGRSWSGLHSPDTQQRM